MARYLLLTIFFLMACLAVNAQTSLEGTVTDQESGEGIVYGSVTLYKNGVISAATETDLEGFYKITELDAGTYTVEFTYTGFNPTKVTGVVVSGGKSNVLNAKISSGAGVQLGTVEIVYRAPIIEQDKTTTGLTLTSEQIAKLPTRDVNSLAALSAGVAQSDEGGALNIRGSRSDATNYYLDGIRVSGRSIPKSEIEELQVVTGGIEAKYGDVTGGLVSVTSKGPSDRFAGGMELETSKYLDPYDQRLGSLNFSGPIWKSKGETVLGYRFAGQYQSNLDDDPPALDVYTITDETRQALEASPIIRLGNSTYPAANYIGKAGVKRLKYNPYENRKAYDLTGKLDASIGKNVDVTLSGTWYQVKDRFTPGVWQVFNSFNNPTNTDERYRGNFRIRHRLGGASSSASGDKGAAQKGALVQNAVYILQFGYEKAKSHVGDKQHGDRLFDYGYVGKYDIGWEPSISEVRIQTPDSIVFEPYQSDYSEILNGFTVSNTINPVLGRYIYNASDAASFDDFEVGNGFITSTLSNIWTNLHSNIGSVYNLNQKRNSDLYTFSASTSFELVPKGSGGSRHSIQFGLWYEQRTNRGYDINPRRLWTAARQLANQHLEGRGLDSSIVIGTQRGTRTVIDSTGAHVDTNYMFNIYAPKEIPDSSDNQFYKTVRAKYGVPTNQFFNPLGLDPNEMSVDLFSARELNDLGLLNYWGYDYLGNQLDGVTFEDFFTAVDANNVRTFPVAADRPNFQSIYLQDKFKFKDVIFRVGVRLDRFDANTKVLRDPYSLYDILGASDFHSKFPDADRPGNIGDDYKVYVTSDAGETIRAYRDGDTWYTPQGKPVNDGREIFGTEIAFPRYTEDVKSKRDITTREFDPDISFEDYQPQLNWMPRLAFSFPISDEANFFAHYDILVQRPPSNTFVSPLTYFYWETSGTGLRNNANLKPERTVDYEVGFQQKLSNSSALKLSAYYKELRDMIQARFFNFVPAPVNSYETYDNNDFATVKGFSIQYELRRTTNLSMQLAYTLQFADGTGSDANSARSISSRGIQRTLFPMNFDERHRINLVMDYRYSSGKQYNGPRIGGVDVLADAGINFTMISVSGRPYTAAVQPAQLGAEGIKGAINGSRLPWNVTVNAQVDKSFNLTKQGAARPLSLNMYVRVSNLLNRKNTQGVYTFTGQGDDDGFLRSERGAGFLEDFDPALSQEAFLSAYSWRMLNPDNYSLPRRIFLGAVFQF